MKRFICFILPFLFFFVLFIANYTPAYAGFDPVSLTIEASIFALLTEVGVSVAASLVLTPLIFAAATAAVFYGIGTFLAQNAPGMGDGTVDPGAAKGTFESSNSPELNAVGRVRLGGLKAFGNTVEDRRYRLTLHCKGETDGYEEFFLGEREVIADHTGDGAVSSFPWQDDLGTWAYIKTKFGTDSETSWSDLQTDFSEIWTPDHRARGIAQSLTKFVNPGLATEKYLQLYQGGVPDVSVTKRVGKNVYDPRTETSQWTENGILNALHILVRTYPEFSLADIDLDFISDEADRADATIATLAGNVARSRCSGVWSSETARGDNLQTVLDSIGALIEPRSGGEKFGLRLYDDVPTAETTVYLRNIVSITWQSGPQGVERPNICRVKYYSPERNYEMAEIDLTGIAWARIDDEITAYGEKYFDVNLPFCMNSGQAQRRARQKFALARADSGINKTNMAGLAVWGCRFANFEFPDDLGTILTMIGYGRSASTGSYSRSCVWKPIDQTDHADIGDSGDLSGRRNGYPRCLCYPWRCNDC